MATYTLNGNANNIIGTNLADIFKGFSGGNDFLRGMGGNDRFEINNWSQQRGTIDGGVGIDRFVMVGHNNHTFNAQLKIIGVEELWADEPNLYASVVQLNAFQKFVPTNAENWWSINIEGAGGTLNFTTKYNSVKRLDIDASNAETRVVVTGSARGDDFHGSEFADIWIGGNGVDKAWGESGADTFRFTALSHSTVAAPDRIEDFFGADKIDLSGLFGPALVYRGQLAFSGLGQVRIVDSGADVLVQVNATGNLSPDFAVRIVGVDIGDIVKGDFIL